MGPALAAAVACVALLAACGALDASDTSDAPDQPDADGDLPDPDALDLPDAAPPAPGEPAIQYVVTPHPDDEYQGWGLVTGRDDTYPVFVVLTQGEATSVCDGSAFHPEHGERAPQPQPFEPGDLDRCAAQRLDAWHAFLDGMAELEGWAPDVDDAASRTGTVADGEPTPAHPRRDDPPLAYDVHVGDEHARVVFDLGDGALTAGEVAWALAETRRATADGAFPVAAEAEVVGASFANPDDHPDCVAYDHPDHVAVDEALWEVDFGIPGPQYSRACATDPRVAADGVAAPVPPDLHEAVWEVDPPPPDPHANADAERTGLAQRVYGWLAFSFADDTRTYWEVADDEAATIFAREQHFWRAHAEGAAR